MIVSDRVAEVLRRVLDLGLEHLGERRQHRAPTFSVSSELRRCATSRPTVTSRFTGLPGWPRPAARVDVGHVDLLVLAPEPLDVRELEAEREQRGEVLVEGFLVERVLGEAPLDGWSSCLVAHGFECV